MKEKPIYKVPLYKSDLEKETQDHLSYEDFNRNTSDTSIQSFRGRIKQFIKGLSGLGCVGDIEIRLVGARAGAGGAQTELVIFHTDTVWLEAGARLSDTQESRLKEGIEVGQIYYKFESEDLSPLRQTCAEWTDRHTLCHLKNAFLFR